jgi:hypothetical protein
MIADERDARSSRETRIERIQSTVDEVLGHITELKREERAGRVKRAHLELDRREVDLEALDEEIRIGIDKLQRV